MIGVELLGYKISKINMISNNSEAGPMQLTNNIKFDIDYAEDNCSAEATLLSHTNYRDDPSKFFLILEMKAIFMISDLRNICEKEKATLMCYDQLFYYIENVNEYLISNTGVCGFRLEKPSIYPEEGH